MPRRQTTARRDSHYIHTLSAEDTEVEQGLVGFKTPQIIQDDINVSVDNIFINIIRLQGTNAR